MVAKVVICANLDDDDDDEGMTPMPPNTIMTLQKSPKFKNMFDQLEFTLNERRIATKALLNIALGSRVEQKLEPIERSLKTPM